MKETAQCRWGTVKQLVNTESQFDNDTPTATTTTTTTSTTTTTTTTSTSITTTSTTTTTTTTTTLRRTTQRVSTIKSSIPKHLSSSPQTPKTTLQKRLTMYFNLSSQK